MTMGQMDHQHQGFPLQNARTCRSASVIQFIWACGELRGELEVEV